ncbi:MAG: hypothetical protein LBL76_03810, partial [Treponema sp.]|nr:hypothetical protein [Treponema sp.]
MKTRSRFFLVHLTAVLGLLLLLSGCKQGSQGKTTITDRAGTLVTISPKQPERIISTAPSNTE